MSEGRELRIRVRLGDYEIEVAGAKEDVLEILGNLDDVVANASSALGARAASAAVPIVSEPKQPEELPHVQMERDIQAPDAIMSLLSTSWGNKPRNLTEMMAALEVNAIHFPKGTVAGRLTDLTRKGALRRVKTPNGFGYVLIKEPQEGPIS